ncbi:unnamed protein product [Haemonchus placei]|uniref:RGS domain-containing protein n=1 Tax=Haemonchus placei TaxID=6290 RepID=A0A0N4WJM8_HAEPC|nr:unnamed protein product [Haemonchus placei]
MGRALGRGIEPIEVPQRTLAKAGKMPRIGPVDLNGFVFVRVRHLSNALDSILSATEHLSIDSGDVNNTTDPDNEREHVTIQSSCVLAQNVDLLLADASALTFFIQFLEYYGGVQSGNWFCYHCAVIILVAPWNVQPWWYFSMQALSPIEIGDTARRKMESEICSDDGRPLRSSFHIAKRNCSLRIHDRYLENFVKSPAYQEFLKELEAEIQYTRFSSLFFFKLEKPGGCVDLQVELPRSNRAVKCGSSSSDTQALLFNQHFDVPDFKSTPPSRSSQPSPLLVRRNRSLNLAEIDCMGQYRVLYDDSLAQDNTTPSKIRQKLRKYLDKSTVREEEIAVEVARTIIADVHSMVEAGKR